jgi:hypothetical protein
MQAQVFACVSHSRCHARMFGSHENLINNSSTTFYRCEHIHAHRLTHACIHTCIPYRLQITRHAFQEVLRPLLLRRTKASLEAVGHSKGRLYLPQRYACLSASNATTSHSVSVCLSLVVLNTHVETVDLHTRLMHLSAGKVK